MDPKMDKSLSKSPLKERKFPQYEYYFRSRPTRNQEVMVRNKSPYAQKTKNNSKNEELLNISFIQDLEWQELTKKRQQASITLKLGFKQIILKTQQYLKIGQQHIKTGQQYLLKGQQYLAQNSLLMAKIMQKQKREKLDFQKSKKESKDHREKALRKLMSPALQDSRDTIIRELQESSVRSVYQTKEE